MRTQRLGIKTGWTGGALVGAASALAGGIAAGAMSGVRAPIGPSIVALAAGAAIGAGLWTIWSRRRSGDVRRLADLFADAGEDRLDPNASPAWLSPLAQAVTEGRSRFLERLQSAENRLREIEIRRRITEAEPAGRVDAAQSPRRRSGDGHLR